MRSKRAASIAVRLYRAGSDRVVRIDTTLVKLVVTPILITTATLLGRRFGQSVAGWLIAFPWTSAPVSFFLAVDHGIPFAAAAARGSIAAIAAECAFVLAYAWTARGWPVALGLGTLAYAAAGLGMQFVVLDPLVLAALMAALLLVTLRLLPQRERRVVAPPRPPAWDLPVRVVVTTAIVILITTVAPTLGPYGSALVATFPLFASVLAVFAERHQGHGSAVDVLRGLVNGLFGFMAFFVVIALALGPLGFIAFAVAVAVVVAVQGVALAALRRAS